MKIGNKPKSINSQSFHHLVAYQIFSYGVYQNHHKATNPIREVTRLIKFHVSDHAYHDPYHDHPDKSPPSLGSTSIVVSLNANSRTGFDPGWREHHPLAHTSSINIGKQDDHLDGYDHWWMIMVYDDNNNDGDENTDDGDDDDDRKERGGRQNGLWPDWDSGWGICPPLSVQPPTSTMSATRLYHIWRYKSNAVCENNSKTTGLYHIWQYKIQCCP